MNIAVVAFLTDPRTALPVQVKQMVVAANVLDAISMMLDVIESTYGKNIENLSFNAKMEQIGGSSLLSSEQPMIQEAA